MARVNAVYKNFHLLSSSIYKICLISLSMIYFFKMLLINLRLYNRYNMVLLSKNAFMSKYQSRLLIYNPNIDNFI